jgi:hypothetical protein
MLRIFLNLKDDSYEKDLEKKKQLTYAVCGKEATKKYVVSPTGTYWGLADPNRGDVLVAHWNEGLRACWFQMEVEATEKRWLHLRRGPWSPAL